MGRKRYIPEEIINELREAEELPASSSQGYSANSNAGKSNFMSVIIIRGSNCLHYTSTQTCLRMISDFQMVIVRIMALRIVISLRMQATKATFLALPASKRRW